jgi:hypothetical protein
VRRGPAGAGLLVGALLLAGCGSDTGPTANPNARTPAPTLAPPTATSAAPSTSRPAPTGSPSERDPRLVVTGYTGFASPSGNIRCGIAPDDGYVRCDIGEREWEPPPRPDDCELDYGSGLDLDETGAGVVCAGDAVGASELVLEYGEKLQGGPILCESQESGMSCEHVETGRGFTIARADYELF